MRSVTLSIGCAILVLTQGGCRSVYRLRCTSWPPVAGVLAGGEDKEESPSAADDKKDKPSNLDMGLLGLGVMGARAGLYHLCGGEGDSLTGYEVHVGAFDGPLDLLLYLVRKHEVDVAEIPIAKITEQYLDFLEVLEQILTGAYPDGLGNVKNVPDRIDFDPFPYHSMAVWILTQMKRW